MRVAQQSKRDPLHTEFNVGWTIKECGAEAKPLSKVQAADHGDGNDKSDNDKSDNADDDGDDE